jgi:hypothetical protein
MNFISFLFEEYFGVEHFGLHSSASFVQRHALQLTLRSICRTEFTSEPLVASDVDAGNVGELAARILLLRASDLAYEMSDMKGTLRNVKTAEYSVR